MDPSKSSETLKPSLNDFLSQSDIIIPRMSGIQSFLQFLVWEAHGLRVMLECILICAVYQGSYLLLSIKGLLPLPIFAHLAILSALTLIVIFFDTQVLCRGNATLKLAFIFSYRGNFKEALKIAEDSRMSMVPPSRACYNLSLSEISALANDNQKAEEYFLRAVHHGANPLECLVTRMRGYFFAGDISRSLQEAEPYLGKSSLLQLEYAIISLTALDNLREARNYCEAVLSRDSILHPSGTETHDLARLVLSCVDLKSGKAEQALPEISMMLALITPQLAIFPGLRPYISLVYLLRAKYFSGQRRTYSKARYDLERALQLCAYPINKKIAADIEKVVGNGLV